MTERSHIGTSRDISPSDGNSLPGGGRDGIDGKGEAKRGDGRGKREWVKLDRIPLDGSDS